MSEAAVNRSDLANFDPDTPLEKLGWAREEMQRNFQHRTILSLRARRPHSEHESSPFFGMYQKQHHQQQE